MELVVSQLTKEILERCSYLDEISSKLSQLQPVSHIKQNKSPIVLVGGIPGAIREIRQNKRLVNLINAPLYEGKSFINIAFEIVETTKFLVDKQVELQTMCDQTIPDYYDNVRRIILSSEGCFKAWYAYSPSMAEEELEKNANLFNTVKAIYEEFRRMNLPDDLKNYGIHYKESDNENSGCMGALIMLLSLSIAGASIYCICHFI